MLEKICLKGKLLRVQVDLSHLGESKVTFMSIEQNVKEIRQKIAVAAKASGRDPKEIVLVAATKMNDADAVRSAITAGVDVCGENRVQELQQKSKENAYEGRPLHFIGHLQKNKVKYLVGVVDLIQSVDSLELMSLIDRRAESMGIIQNILLEVNIGREEAKSGLMKEDLELLLNQAGLFPNVHVCGLMAIPPASDDPEMTRPYFAQMRQLFIDISMKKYDNVSMDFLSMGMTHDYETAIEEGSNMVRIGTGIFGERNYGNP